MSLLDCSKNYPKDVKMLLLPSFPDHSSVQQNQISQLNLPLLFSKAMSYLIFIMTLLWYSLLLLLLLFKLCLFRKISISNLKWMMKNQVSDFPQNKQLTVKNQCQNKYKKNQQKFFNQTSNFNYSISSGKMDTKDIYLN